MILYKHEFSWNQDVEVTSVEVKETPKMYKTLKRECLVGWRSQINKDEIGKVLSGYARFEAVYLEPNISKFIEEIIKHENLKIKNNNNQIAIYEKHNAKLRSDISKLETKLQDLHH